MFALLDSIRDFVLALALSWVGIAVQPKPAPRPDQSTCPMPSANTTGACTVKPGFDADGCDKN